MSSRRAHSRPARNGDVSFWYADAGGLPRPSAPLAGRQVADICIIGAGFTGLWTAYYLKRANPALDIRILERAFAGFGASGRNGGWLTGGFAWSHSRYLARGGREGLRAMIAALAHAPREVIAVARAEGISADIVETDELALATNSAQWARARAEHEARLSWEVPEDRTSLIDAHEATARIAVPGLCGAFVQHGVARVQPALLVQGLAGAVRRLGVRIYEGTEATSVAPGRVATRALIAGAPVTGAVSAPVILRATEGFTPALPGHRRDLLPLNSALIVTKPLPAALWERIGWQGRELVGDIGHVYFYAQRTREGRIALGGRGQPYRFASRIDRGGEASPVTVARLAEILHRIFPAVQGLGLAHAWGGVLGVPRDWCARVELDRTTGLGWAGGYVGVGLATSNLAGRTLADLVLGRETALTALPWVNHRVRRWEPEPLRWAGVAGMYALLSAADRLEHRGAVGGEWLARLAGWLGGR